jgi:serine/threonine-protein phosphatase PGAM5
MPPRAAVLPAASKVLYLVRHGQYQGADAATGTLEALTPLGRRQAVRLGRRLAALPFDAIWHSDLPRAVETAQIVAEQLPGVPRRASKLLREGIPTVAAHFSPEFRPPRAQLLATRQRMDRAFDRFVRAGRKPRMELVVAHGNIIRYLIRRALGDAADRWWQLDAFQCGLSVLRVGRERCALMAFNDVGHLPLRMLTYL